jgi:hypothetical protein
VFLKTSPAIIRNKTFILEKVVETIIIAGLWAFEEFAKLHLTGK